LDLFSGIGGFSLGLERSGGFKTVAFCEIEPFCRRVLAKHWPGVPCYDDVRSLTTESLSRDGITVEAICGGFPCQDISTAGKGAGIDGKRSGLWTQYARIIGEIQPRYVIVENVSALLGRGIDRVLGDLVSLGYDAEWHCIPASYVGAPHRRDRVWIVAYSGCEFRQSFGVQRKKSTSGRASDGPGNSSPFMADAKKLHRNGRENHAGSGCEGRRQISELGNGCGYEGNLADANSQSPRRLAISWCEFDQWFVEPDVGRVAHGVPARVDRLRALGNAVVPQIPELIGRAILASEAAA
jgi:DNA (cytosine-5)-methyltransferase 1